MFSMESRFASITCIATFYAKSWSTLSGWPSDLIAANLLDRLPARAFAFFVFFFFFFSRVVTLNSPLSPACLSVALQIPVRLYPPAVIMARGVPRKSKRGPRRGNLALPSWESIFPPVAISFRLPSIRILHATDCTACFFMDDRKKHRYFSITSQMA